MALTLYLFGKGLCARKIYFVLLCIFCRKPALWLSIFFAKTNYAEIIGISPWAKFLFFTNQYSHHEIYIHPWCTQFRREDSEHTTIPLLLFKSFKVFKQWTKHSLPNKPIAHTLQAAKLYLKTNIPGTSEIRTLTSSLSLWRRWLQRSRKQCPPMIHSFWMRLWKPSLVLQWGSIITCTREEMRQQRSEAFSSRRGPSSSAERREGVNVKKLQTVLELAVNSGVPKTKVCQLLTVKL